MRFKNIFPVFAFKGIRTYTRTHLYAQSHLLVSSWGATVCMHVGVTDSHAAAAVCLNTF